MTTVVEKNVTAVFSGAGSLPRHLLSTGDLDLAGALRILDTATRRVS